MGPPKTEEIPPSSGSSDKLVATFLSGHIILGCNYLFVSPSSLPDCVFLKFLDYVLKSFLLPHLAKSLVHGECLVNIC